MRKKFDQLLTIKMYDEYLNGKSLLQLKEKFEIPHNTIRLWFLKSGFKLRERVIKPKKTFNGEKYYLASDGYWRNTKQTNIMLHQKIWEHHNGTTLNLEIRHIDGNKSNNDIKNLVAITKNTQIKPKKEIKPVKQNFVDSLSENLSEETKEYLESLKNIKKSPLQKGVRKRG